MSDEATTPPKRAGRKAAVAKSPADSKKRQRKEVKHVDSGDEDDVAAPKRGRGRPPKGSKKKAPPKGKGGKSGPGLRGRPKKDANGKASEDEDKEENSEGEEEDD